MRRLRITLRVFASGATVLRVIVGKARNPQVREWPKAFVQVTR